MAGWLVFAILIAGYFVTVTAAVACEPRWLSPNAFTVLAFVGAIGLAVYGQWLYNTTWR